MDKRGNVTVKAVSVRVKRRRARFIDVRKRIFYLRSLIPDLKEFVAFGFPQTVQHPHR